uniref:uncharacterized protein LOC101301121 isoform X2 n=1 Tax=Fragaria vesca subsp. vesca TaxID=101020 RepID=UPI0005C7F7E9|nr:PREDICTED: uncharacterized protein LOC101301121 isoform X2 [Fragaria vesca subsp. vesca]
MGIERKTRTMEMMGTREKKKVEWDRPIYLQVRAEDKSCLWFVIEDGRRPREQGSEENDDDDDKVIFHGLDLPQLDYLPLPNSLVVLNSRLYMIGGRKYTGRRGSVQYSFGYDHVDLSEQASKQQWRFEKDEWTLYSTGSVACSDDGLVYTLAPRRCYRFRFDPRSGGDVRSEFPSEFPIELGVAPHLVSISNKYIYAYSKGARSNTLVRFDLEKKEWECLYRNFWGRLAPGVVLYGDSYLVCFGTKKPTCSSLFSQQPGLYMFDIRQSQWLDQPVKGLDDALPVIPEGFEEDRVYNYFLPLLFQIGTQRFALVWGDYLENVGCEIHCHKFTFDYTPSGGSDGTTEKNHPPTSFVARRLSNGVLIQQDGTLLGCTVGISARSQKLRC